MKPITKHDCYVQELKNMIAPFYDKVLTHVEFKLSRKTKAEIDIFAIKGSRIDLYEVKCSYRIVKAKKQLQRAKRALKAKGETYFYWGNAKTLIPIHDL